MRWLPQRPVRSVITVEDTEGIVPEWTLGDRLRKARLLTNLEQKDLAEAMGLAPTTIGSYEKGITPPKLGVLKLWSMATGVSLAWLQTGEGRKARTDGE
ncbi:MAG: family transcriptional regulator [Mycobacterium sp.]|nr:family transcriptional regulator [Mycobacterium sp.]